MKPVTVKTGIAVWIIIVKIGSEPVTGHTQITVTTGNIVFFCFVSVSVFVLFFFFFVFFVIKRGQLLKVHLSF